MNIEIVKMILQEAKAIRLQMKHDNDELEALNALLEVIDDWRKGSSLESTIDELNPKSNFKHEPKSDPESEPDPELKS